MVGGVPNNGHGGWINLFNIVRGDGKRQRFGRLLRRVLVTVIFGLLKPGYCNLHNLPRETMVVAIGISVIRIQS